LLSIRLFSEKVDSPECPLREKALHRGTKYDPEHDAGQKEKNASGMNISI